MTLATTNENALAVVGQQVVAILRTDAPLGKEDKGRLMEMARYLVANGLAPKNDSAEAVVAKFMAGRELGLAPMQALVDLYVVNGQVLGDTRVLGSQLRAGGWDYWYTETSMERASVVLLSPNGREHALTVTYDECHGAGWDQGYGGKEKQTWQGGGRAIMLRYRVLSQAIRAFAADTLNLRVDKARVQRLGGDQAPDDAATIREIVQRLGPTATMGLVVQVQGEIEAAKVGGASGALAITEPRQALARHDGPAGEDDPLDADFTDAETTEDDDLEGDNDQEAEPPTRAGRPYPPEMVREGIQSRAGKGSAEMADARRQGFVAGALDQLFANAANPASRKAARYSLMHYLLGKTTTKELTQGECTALLAWAQTQNRDGDWVISDHAIAEAAMILQAVGAANGQQALL